MCSKSIFLSILDYKWRSAWLSAQVCDWVLYTIYIISLYRSPLILIVRVLCSLSFLLLKNKDHFFSWFVPFHSISYLPILLMLIAKTIFIEWSHAGYPACHLQNVIPKFENWVPISNWTKFIISKWGKKEQKLLDRPLIVFIPIAHCIFSRKCLRSCIFTKNSQNSQGILKISTLGCTKLHVHFLVMYTFEVFFFFHWIKCCK